MTAKGVEGELISEAREIARQIIEKAPIDCKIILHTNKLNGLENDCLQKLKPLNN